MEARETDTGTETGMSAARYFSERWGVLTGGISSRSLDVEWVAWMGPGGVNTSDGLGGPTSRGVSEYARSTY